MWFCLFAVAEVLCHFKHIFGVNVRSFDTVLVCKNGPHQQRSHTITVWFINYSSLWLTVSPPHTFQAFKMALYAVALETSVNIALLYCSTMTFAKGSSPASQGFESKSDTFVFLERDPVSKRFSTLTTIFVRNLNHSHCINWALGVTVGSFNI